MKKLFICVLAFSMLSGCKDQKSSKEKTDSEVKTESTVKDDYSNEKKDGEVKSTDQDKPVDNTANDDNTIMGDGGWTTREDNEFMSSCEGTATPNVGAARANEYCDCVLQKLKKLYPSYAEANRQLAGKEADATLKRLTDECNGKR